MVMRQYSVCLGLVLALGCSAGSDSGEAGEQYDAPGSPESATGAGHPSPMVGDVAAEDTTAGDDLSSEDSLGADSMDPAVGSSGSFDAQRAAMEMSGLVPPAEMDLTELPPDFVDEHGVEDQFDQPLEDPPLLAAGECCAGSDCLCHGDPPLSLSARRGPFRTATVRMSAGTAHYPTNAEPPFAGVAICPGFLNSGPEMTSWGTFYASWGIVTVVTNTFPFDFPDVRGRKLLAAVAELKRLNTNALSPLSGKMSNRYGTSGYSMGGGGTTLASRSDRTLKTSIGLAAWAPSGLGVQTPTLFFCGGADIIAPCSGSQGAYLGISNSTPKMIISIPLLGHLSWFGPNDTSGGWGLAFQKVFLEGDERWKQLLTRRPALGSFTTNIR